MGKRSQKWVSELVELTLLQNELYFEEKAFVSDE